jgi:hypothetical protein
MKNAVLLGILVIAIAVGLGAFSMKRAGRQTTPTATPGVSPSVVVGESPTPEQFITSEPDLSTLRAGGSSYLDPQGLYNVLYPGDWALDTQDAAHIRVYKSGPSARPQSEISDGALVVFETVDLQGKSLEAFVDARIQEATGNGMSEMTETKRAVMLNNYPGFTYKMRGLGESTYLLVHRTPQSNQAISITYMVVGPQAAKYQQEVDGILSSVELLK